MLQEQTYYEKSSRRPTEVSIIYAIFPLEFQVRVCVCVCKLYGIVAANLRYFCLFHFPLWLMLQVGDLIRLLENSNLSSSSWFAFTLMTERFHEDAEICSGFFFKMERWILTTGSHETDSRGRASFRSDGPTLRCANQRRQSIYISVSVTAVRTFINSAAILDGITF